jgi:hypothetical protein
MSAIAKSANGPSLATTLPANNNKHSGQWFAGAALNAFDAVYIDSSGLVQLAQDTGASTAASQVDGYAAKKYAIGEPVTIMHGVEVNYAAATMTPGSAIYLSAAVAGGLDTAAQNSHAPVGTALTASIAYLVRRRF